MFDRAADKNFEVLVAENRFVTDVQLAIERAMKDAHLSQADLARALNVSEASVSQMLADTGRNFKARTIARIAHVLGLHPLLNLVDRRTYAQARATISTVEDNPRQNDEQPLKEWIKSLENCPTKRWEMACNDDEMNMELEAA